ncbi:MAG: glycosyltransferase family 2 protein [Lachnospiraceae bacterium]|jgi:glycosyltransferase involved in cell wall biosynthesis|nr:glycosyltransferase family 2 protein [Lachnospiraceae bacterium]
MDKLYIIIPAYNEEETIGEVIGEWYPIVEKIGGDSRLVIVNDGSKDHTEEIVQNMQADRPQLILLTKENGGHGPAIRYGYEYAVKEGADFIFQTDSDGQTVAEEFWRFWKHRSEYDFVVGCRTKREDGFSRLVVTRTLRVVVRACFGVWLRDVNTPFRLVKRELMEEALTLIPEDFNLANVALSVIAAKKGARMLSIPITFRPRQGGVNSINIPKITKMGMKAVGDFMEMNKKL